MTEVTQATYIPFVSTRNYNVEVTSKTSDGKLQIERATYEVTTYDHKGKISTWYTTSMTTLDYLI